jgi:hypothetical protein
VICGVFCDPDSTAFGRLFPNHYQIVGERKPNALDRDFAFAAAAAAAVAITGAWGMRSTMS